MATCKKCGAPIIWLKTPKGKWMCADEGLVPYRTDPEGKDLVCNDYGEMIRCEILPEDECRAGKRNPSGRARIPHWATCPNADDFRKGAKE